MRKLLLFFTLCLAAMSVKAANFTWTEDGKTVTASSEGNLIQKLELSGPGALAAFVEATKDLSGNELMGVGGNSQRVELVITGEMNSDDFSALSSEVANRWGTFKNIDLSGVTVSNVSDAAGMKLSGVEYLHMPSNFSSTDMQSLCEDNSKYPNLKIAASRNTTVSPTEANFYQKDQNGGNVGTFMSKYWSNWFGQWSMPNNGPEKINMAGYFGDTDLIYHGQYGNNWNMFHSPVRYWDFTGATMLQCTVNIESNGSYGDKAQGKKDDGTYLVTKKDKCTETNALYWLKNYNPWEVTLPTGNNEIPPKTFFCDNSNSENALRKVTIPEGYTTIGFEAFFGSWLESVALPSTIEYVGNGAFSCNSGNSRLAEFTMKSCQNDCNFGQMVFAGDHKLKTAVIGEGVMEMGYCLFQQCALLESVRIPSTCTIIDSYAFDQCSSMHSIVIPEGVRLIERGAFTSTALTDIYVMASSPDMVPLIYDAGIALGSNKPATFGHKSLDGNNTSAANSHAGDTNLSEQSYETVLTWYQEDQSGGNLGLQNCLCVLHYPDNMKPFYDGIPDNDYLSEEGVENWRNNIGQSDITLINNKLENAQYLSDAYKVGSTDNSSRRLGPTEGDLYWPAQFDYSIRLAAGGTPNDHIVPGNWGWRQFSLHGDPASDPKKTFIREYDETWYTMCFPWDMEDEELFQAFNKTCEIAEFVGAEVQTIDAENYEYALVLHFDEVSKTYYMDKKRTVYTRVNDGDPVNVQMGQVTVPVQYYIYTPVKRYNAESGEFEDITGGTPISYKNQSADMKSKYLQIHNIQVLAGHPYMIHPDAIGEPGSPAECVIVGTEVEGVDAEKQKVTKVASTRTAPMNSYNDTPTPFVSPKTNKGGSYDFIGNIGDGNADMPIGSYFLATKGGTDYYPKYYRKVSGGQGKWTQYTAIIRPDADALANIEALDGANASANGDVIFGEWEEVEATAIEEIIADAQEKGQEVKEIHLNIVYNINGQVVNTSGQIEGLPRGLYIVNGKKYMVK